MTTNEAWARVIAHMNRPLATYALGDSIEDAFAITLHDLRAQVTRLERRLAQLEADV